MYLNFSFITSFDVLVFPQMKSHFYLNGYAANKLLLLLLLLLLLFFFLNSIILCIQVNGLITPMALSYWTDVAILC